MIPADKLAHVLGGAAIAGVLTAYGVDPAVAFAASAIAGVAKEAIDQLGHGTPEVLDAVATIAGGASVLPLAAWPGV